jgi:hypothetical protein
MAGCMVYATRQGGRDALMTSTLDGKIKARLAGQGGDIREPGRCTGPRLLSLLVAPVHLLPD